MDIQSARDIIYLASCAVNDKIPDHTRVSDMDLDVIYEIARRHMITAAIAMALENAGFKDDRSSRTIAKALYRTVMFQNALTAVKTELEKAKIWYLPLKGIILKELYPKDGMREFADHDILIDSSRAGDVKEIMERLGFTTKHFGTSNHDIYHKAPMLNFEMHTALFGPEYDEKIYNYYRHVKSRLIGSGYEKSMSPEDYYLYHLAHEYKHYSGGGTGLRSLMDTYVWLKANRLDMDYICREASKLGLSEFEKKNRALSMGLFENGECRESELEMLDYILSSGTYGSRIHRIENTMKKNGWNKIQYVFHRFSVPLSKKNSDYQSYKAGYPFFYRHKLLLPLLPFYRTMKVIREGRFRRELQAIMRAKI